MRAEDVIHWDAVARAGFTYETDPADRDQWRSRAELALMGVAWRGDCDDLASTALDLMSRAGEPLSGLYRLVVDSSRCGHPDHMIACIWDDAGQCWVVGDTFDPAYIAEDCPHRPVQYQRMDDITVWREGAPWA